MGGSNRLGVSSPAVLCHRHSGSSTARVRLLRSPEEVKLEVSDEGRGLDQQMRSKIASGQSAGVGLRGIQERLRHLGGSVEIHSNGKGTTVTAIMPFAESPQGAVGRRGLNRFSRAMLR